MRGMTHTFTTEDHYLKKLSGIQFGDNVSECYFPRHLQLRHSVSITRMPLSQCERLREVLNVALAESRSSLPAKKKPRFSLLTADIQNSASMLNRSSPSDRSHKAHCITQTGVDIQG